MIPKTRITAPACHKETRPCNDWRIRSPDSKSSVTACSAVNQSSKSLIDASDQSHSGVASCTGGTPAASHLPSIPSEPSPPEYSLECPLCQAPRTQGGHRPPRRRARCAPACSCASRICVRGGADANHRFKVGIQQAVHGSCVSVGGIAAMTPPQSAAPPEDGRQGRL
jgi:hypothetical protein